MADFTAAQRFGWDAPARIHTTTDYYAGASEMSLPGEPTYPVILPFLNASGLNVVGGGLTPVVPEFRDEPSGLNLFFTSGNDVTIPVIFRDTDTNLDMSDAGNWDWYAQVRTGIGILYPLVAEFICEAEYTPALLPDVPYGYTTVKLYLPRQDNVVSGDYYWDLKSVAPASLGPDEGDPDPTPGVAHTWLSGEVSIAPAVTLPPDEIVVEVVELVPAFDSFHAVTTGHGTTVGPNGQVP